MSGREQLPDQHVPDVVLEELLAAFGTPSPGDGDGTESVSYDFDDPSIDRLLGIETEELRRRAGDADRPPPAGPPPPSTVTAGPTGATTRLTGPATSATTRLDPGPAGATSLRTARTARRDRDAAPAPAAPPATSPGAPAVDGSAVAAPPAATAGTPSPAASAAAAPVTDAKRSRKERKADKLAAAVAPPAPAPEERGRRTIVIADDDQHIDPIYLDEDAEQRMREVHGASSPGPSGRPTIVIDEFDQHTDAVSAVAAISTAIDPRLRARRIAVRRAVGRRRLIWAGIIAAVVLVAVAVTAVLASSLFDVRTIDTQGNVYTDPALILAVQREMRGKPILLVDTKKLEEELETGPWIESARVSTDFPHHALIDIRERIAQATFAGSDGRYRVIDRDGRVLAVLGGRPTAYMLLTGTAPDSEPGQFAGTAYAAAAQLVIALPPEVRAITTSIAVETTTNEMTLALDAANAPGVTARVGTVGGIEDKLARLLRFVQDGLTPDQHLDVSTVEVGSTVGS